ncbi:YopX family protein [Algibacter sp. PT7-4]|uniref:YopX family protein n=1 Tax=Algibacter ulvanivorans TaxID=3400999 RepID=UPI003AAC91E5
MRELKFRAFCEVETSKGTINDMVYFEKLECDNGLWFNAPDNAWHINEYFAIMQYVGLKDNFGNEIYEGDVVRWDDGSDGEKWRVAVVEINPDLQFRIIKINCDFKQSAKEGYVFKFGRFIYTDTENHLEIIGNVHQKEWKK